MEDSYERKRKETLRAYGDAIELPRSKAKRRKNPTRRTLLKTAGVGAAIVIGAAGKAAYNELNPEVVEEIDTIERAPADTHAFEERILRRRQSFLSYRPNYIYLLNAEGQRVGDPLPVNDVPGTLSPDVPEIGAADAAEVNQDWLAAQYRRAHISVPEGGARCEVAAMSFMDVIRHYADDPAKGEALKIGHVSLLDYLDAHIGEAVASVDDPWTRARLSTTVPALIGIESNFDNRAHSSTGAKGAVQHTRRSWDTIGRTLLNRHLDENSFADQVAFLGAHLADTFKSFSHASRAIPAFSWLREHLFGESEGADQRFTRLFVFPSGVTAYNTGTGVTLDAVIWFKEECEKVQRGEPSELGPMTMEHLKRLARNDLPELFYYMASSANGKVERFGEEANGYYAKIYALEPLIEDLRAPRSAGTP